MEHGQGFVVETAMPLCAVVIVVVVLTLAIFDPPPLAAQRSGPAPKRAQADRIERMPAPVGASPRPERPAGSAQWATEGGETPREAEGGDKANEMNRLVARAVRALAQPETSERPIPSANIDLVAAIRQLGAAVNTARNARDDKDLARAEEMMREVRTQMERSCGAPDSPLCQSARSMRELGY